MIDYSKTPPYEEMRQLYSEYFSLGHINADINSKFALISLVGYLVYTLKQKKPGITSYRVIKSIIKDELPEDFIKGFAVVVDDFSYGCKEFPTFGIEPKKIPAKVKELLMLYLPF